MPEGHTIHRLARDLSRDFAGATLSVSSPQGRFATAAFDGARLDRAHAVGKHLLLEFDAGRIHIHLGLFGRFRRHPPMAPAPRPSVRLRLQGELRCWDLSGPTICAAMSDVELTQLEARLGADPLSPAPRTAQTWLRVHRSKRSMAALLLDQSIFAGVGNVYRAELLFLTGVHPELPGNALEKPRFEKLWKLARELLQRGVRANRIVTVTGATASTRKKEALYVYKQKHCRVCNASIVKTTNATRTMFHCPTCQPPLVPASL
jgi:endonuclease VIII